MRVVHSGALLAALLILGGTFTLAAEPQAVDASVRASLDAAHDAMDRVAGLDREGATTRLESAVADAQAALATAESEAGRTELGRKKRVVKSRVKRLVKKLEKAAAFCGDPRRDDAAVEKKVIQAAKAATSALSALKKFPADVFALTGAKAKKGGFHKPGKTVTLVFRAGDLAAGGTCGEAPVVTVASARDGVDVIASDVVDNGDGTFDVTLGTAVGGVIVSATACGATRTWRLFNRGPKGALRLLPPATVTYPGPTAWLRAGQEPDWTPTLTGGAPERFDVEPALPAGVTVDPVTGALTGAPTTSSTTASYTVTAANARGRTSTSFDVQVTPALPDAFDYLADGFRADPVLNGAEVPVKMVRAPDGRLFFTELATGKIRVIGTDGALKATPFATVDVLTGSERGLLGIALAPDFAQSGHLFVFASTRGGDGKVARNRVLRYTAQGDVGTDMQVIVDDLPIGFVQNGGDLQFGPDGHLYVSVGDTGVESTSQEDGGRGGRILRFTASGGIPSDNPTSNDASWCLGLRNSFDMAFHPTTGGLFATENGPTAHDELNLIQKGKNYVWGHDDPESIPGFSLGALLRDWTPVIVPTGIAWHDGTGLGAEFTNNLLLLSYDTGEIQRLVLSGAAFTDLDDEIVFARFHAEDGVENKPLDVLVEPDGAIVVSTFAGIWRVDRFER